MPLFLTLLAPKAKGPEAVDYIKKLTPPLGIEIREIGFTFGRYDVFILYTAPDEKAAMNFVMKVALDTGWTAETLVAVPIKEFV